MESFKDIFRFFQIEGSTETYADVNIALEAGASVGTALSDLNLIYLGKMLKKIDDW